MQIQWVVKCGRTKRISGYFDYNNRIGSGFRIENRGYNNT